MLPTAAEIDFARAGLPEPPPWKREQDYRRPIRDSCASPASSPSRSCRSSTATRSTSSSTIAWCATGVVLHALTEAYRNIIPPTSYPVVLLFLEMPPQEVDVNVHPAKTEVRFRQPSFVHDFIRDTVRTTLMTARPAASFAGALNSAPNAAASLLIDVSPMPGPPETRSSRREQQPESEAIRPPRRRRSNLRCVRRRCRNLPGAWRSRTRESRWDMKQADAAPAFDADPAGCADAPERR